MFQINGRNISRQEEPYIIAEMSGNHNGSLDRAMAIVEAAAAAGAHAIKLQTYTADTMTIDIREREFWISDKDSLWEGNSLYELYQRASTPWDWHAPLMERARSLGLVCFSSPFDATAVDFLESLHVPAYKIASFENTDVRLIRRVAQTGKPVILSTGMATLEEIAEAVRCARDAGCQKLMLLKCTSSYPASPERSNVRTIPHLREAFDVPVGLSDHTLGIGAAVASVALGAVAVEKHFTLDRNDGGVDSAFSLDPAELKLLVSETKSAWQSLGSVRYGATDDETKSLQFRRTLYVTQDVKAGDVFSERNVRAIRPGFGLPVKFFELILGRRAAKDIPMGTAMSWDLVG